MDELVAVSGAQYVEIACKLARDSKWRNTCSRKITDALKALHGRPVDMQWLEESLVGSLERR